MTFVTTACTTLYENFVKKDEIKQHVYFVLCLSLTIHTGCFNQCEILYSTMSSEMLQYSSTLTCTDKPDVKVCTMEYSLSCSYILQVRCKCLVRQKLWWFRRGFFDNCKTYLSCTNFPILLSCWCSWLDQCFSELQYQLQKLFLAGNEDSELFLIHNYIN